MILFSTADGNFRRRVESRLDGYPCEYCSPSLLWTRLRDLRAKVLILFHGAAEDSSLEQAAEVRMKFPSLPVILIAEASAPDLASEAYRAGLTDYLREPLGPRDLAQALDRCLSGHAANPLGGEERLIGNSPGMREVKAQIQRIAGTSANVLITGETGTGKELVAELLHRNSIGRTGPLVCVNCAAIPDTLLESELFGYEKGAFTGAAASRQGKLEQADGGTIFLDEIGELNSLAQSKLLRAIETRQIDRLGGRTNRTVNVRIIAATNRELERVVESGGFRSDLYFRLSVVRLHLPPLRERKQDIPHLLDYFISELNSRFGRQVRALTDESIRQLICHDWPGNVRELKNVLEASFVELPYPSMRYLELSEGFRKRLAATATTPSTERERVLAALMYNNWNKSRAAEQLQWSRMTLYRKMARYELAAGKTKSA